MSTTRRHCKDILPLKKFNAVLAAGALLAAQPALPAPFAYVPNEQGQLVVVDLATTTIATRITIQSSIAGIAASPSANRVYVTDAFTHTLQVIDTSINSTIATRTICPSPSVPALNPAGTRLVVPCLASGIDPGSVLTFDTSTFTGQASAARDARTAVWDPQGTRYFVAGRDTVYVFDASTNQQIGSVAVPPVALSMVINPAGTRLYVASLGEPAAASEPRIVVIDLASGATIATIRPGTEPTWMAMNPAGTLLYVAMAQADTMQAYSTVTNQLAGGVSFPAGSRPSSIAVHPDGSRVLVEFGGMGYIQALRADPPFLPIASVFYGMSGFAWGNFIGSGSAVRAAQAPGYLSGVWFDASESGWGIQITERHNKVVATWYTYDDVGNQIWYILPGCTLDLSLTCAGTVYTVHGGQFFGGFDMSRSHVDVAGSVQLQFTDVDNGYFNYSIGTSSRRVPIERTRVGTGSTPPAVNFTDLWWNPNESGWGMGITHQPGNMFLAWYVYDARGNPAWFAAPCAPNSAGNACDGTLYRTAGPPFNQPFDPTLVRTTPAGTIHVRFTDPDNGVITYTVDGVDGTRNITRLIF